MSFLGKAVCSVREIEDWSIYFGNCYPDIIIDAALMIARDKVTELRSRRLAPSDTHNGSQTLQLRC